MAQLEKTAPPAAPSASSATGPRTRHWVRKVLAIALVAAMVPVGWSYARALTAPGSAPLAARTVEWFKYHGGRGIVLWAERVWYDFHKPPVGGTPQGGLPYASNGPGMATASPTARHHRRSPPHLAPPPDIRPIAASPLPHEGVWQAVGRTVDGLTTVRVAFLRPDPVHTSVVAAVAWMDTKLLHATLVPGTQVPPGSPWQRGWGAEVPRALRSRLVATFNSGFLLQDSHGGYYLNGTTYAPLVPGQASVVVYRNGKIAVGRWGSDVTMSPDVAAVRQNLSLIVAHGRPVPGLATSSFAAWGATLGNSAYVWRSGLGVTADGALVYAAGPDLTVQSLADVLARAGAVRAMELDINTDWVTYNWYRPAPRSPSLVSAHKLLPSMYRPSDRYLVPDERDFFAMLIAPRLRSPGSP